MKQASLPIMTAAEAAANHRPRPDHWLRRVYPGRRRESSACRPRRAREGRARRRAPFKVSVLTGASTGPTIDGALAKAEAISFRAPTSRPGAARADQLREGALLRHASVDRGTERPLRVPRSGALGGGRGVRPHRRRRRRAHLVGWRDSTYLNQAQKVIIELNAHHPSALLGMHDIFEPQTHRRGRKSISITRATASAARSASSIPRRSSASC